MDEVRYSITQVTHHTGLPASTIRYYESIGLIPQAHRYPSSGRRYFLEADMAYIHGLACLNAAGFTLEEIRRYMENLTEGSRDSAALQVKLLHAYEQRLEHEEQILQLRRKYADLKLTYWQSLAEGKTAEAKTTDSEIRSLVERLRLLVQNQKQ
ncbi:MAG: MerR family transcriptional regulator [Corynebacterium sp.]|nr:MerR family transcriptional regulator [Corynebacterium sp.]